MNPILTIINDGVEDNITGIIMKNTIAITNKVGGQSIHEIDFDQTASELNDLFHSRELALVEGLRKNIVDKQKGSDSNDFIEGQFLGQYNQALFDSIAELDEAITHLKK
jgi:hypothetical protein